MRGFYSVVSLVSYSQFSALFKFILAGQGAIVSVWSQSSVLYLDLGQEVGGEELLTNAYLIKARDASQPSCLCGS